MQVDAAPAAQRAQASGMVPLSTRQACRRCTKPMQRMTQVLVVTANADAVLARIERSAGAAADAQPAEALHAETR